MQLIIKQLHRLLLKTGKTLSVAESCTGGMLSTMLTHNSGSSRYFLLGAVTYSNTAKTRFLGIPSSIIRKNGAVSSEVAILMAKGVRKIARSDLSIAITGIAGPTGAAKDKPLGTVYIAAAKKGSVVCRKFNFKGNRGRVRAQSCLSSLKLISELLLE